jgi:hypothetical protein
MNKMSLMLVFLLLGLSVAAQDQLIINGKTNTKAEIKVFLFKWGEVKPVKIDSTIAKDGSFRFQKKTQLPGVFFLTFERSRMPIALFPEKDSLLVSVQLSAGNGNIISYSVSGSSMQTAYANYIQVSKTLSKEYNSLSEAYNKASDNFNPTEKKRLDNEMKIKETQMNDLEFKMIDDNTSNLLSIFFLVNNRDKFDYASMKRKLDKLPVSLQKNEQFTFLQKHLLKIKQ